MKLRLHLFLLTASSAIMSCKKDKILPGEELNGSTWRLSEYTIEAKAINSSDSQLTTIFRPCFGLDEYTLASDGRVLWTQLDGTCTHGLNFSQQSKNEAIGTWHLCDTNTKLQIKSTWGWVAWEMGYDYQSSKLDDSHIIMTRQYKSFNQDTLYTRELTFKRVK
ncbi:hypothetical protein DNI29_14755 [Hymenobacter sediminis]|uniref:hypothetical protein n=1 Tax=Hymenobacter sediminis TaxID=2218621 RepID=UPI000DA696F3|nr:hypothetical protein [Hymenobacter sediminis]RPD46259.1 hypothetical protein DNI29_14755 [Hymenobacter sediminis]